MLRTAGAGLLFFACCLAGILAGKNERRRTAECEAFLALFRHVKNQVGYFLAPTKQIYRTFDDPVLRECGFLDALAAREGDEIYYDAWHAALASCRGALHLTDGQLRTVEAFGACIGKSNEALQMKNFDYYIGEMSAMTERQKTEMQKNIKLYRTLGFAVGAAIAILVI